MVVTPIVTEGGIRQALKATRSQARTVAGFAIRRTAWNRHALSTFTWCRTDKGPQRAWLHKIGKAESSVCPCVHHTQDGWHLVFVCPLLHAYRQALGSIKDWEDLDRPIWIEEEEEDNWDAVEAFFGFLACVPQAAMTSGFTVSTVLTVSFTFPPPPAHQPHHHSHYLGSPASDNYHHHHLCRRNQAYCDHDHHNRHHHHHNRNHSRSPITSITSTTITETTPAPPITSITTTGAEVNVEAFGSHFHITGGMVVGTVVVVVIYILSFFLVKWQGLSKNVEIAKIGLQVEAVKGNRDVELEKMKGTRVVEVEKIAVEKEKVKVGSA
ncbi:hypothetical protein BGX38DRAFT_1269491 [Terfezia claveryi]|nr:hypothetical protein BGX38DRAFT_1269491 [Terfezia claveryi]